MICLRWDWIAPGGHDMAEKTKPTAVQSQNAVPADFTNKHILPFGFAGHNCPVCHTVCEDYIILRDIIYSPWVHLQLGLLLITRIRLPIPGHPYYFLPPQLIAADIIADIFNP